MLKTLQDYIQKENARSAWKKGVKDYALELLENLEGLSADKISNVKLLRKHLLNGAADWFQYSWAAVRWFIMAI